MSPPETRSADGQAPHRLVPGAEPLAIIRASHAPGVRQCKLLPLAFSASLATPPRVPEMLCLCMDRGTLSRAVAATHERLDRIDAEGERQLLWKTAPFEWPSR